MSSTNIEDVKGQGLNDDSDLKNQVDEEEDQSKEELKDSDYKNDENPMPTSEQEEEIIRKKYGGMLPKKKPLISKDHERAFFDSADWALGKQEAQKPKGPLEALRPKLQATPHHQVRSRRSAYAPADDSDVDDANNHTSPEDENCTSNGGNDENTAPEEQKCHG